MSVNSVLLYSSFFFALVNYEFVIAKLHDSNSELYIFINNLEGDYIQFSKANFV